MLSFIFRGLIRCSEKDSSFEAIEHGKFWLYKNFISASENVRCFESITLTTHCDFTFLYNIVPLLERFVDFL